MHRVVRSSAVAALLACMLCGPAKAQLADADEQRLAEGVRRSTTLGFQGDGTDKCRLIDELQPLGTRSWTLHGLDWQVQNFNCSAPPRNGRSLHASAEAIAREAAPMREHFAHPPAGAAVARDARMLVELAYWDTLIASGFDAQAHALEATEVQRLLDLPDAVGQGDLTLWANRFYGARGQTERMAQWHERLVARFGPGHTLPLVLLRAMAFNHRLLARPQQALALADQAAALAAAHQPDNTRLRISIASERGNCLFDVGRFAEAQDELLAVRHYMLAQTPLPHGNLMRSSYNLAGLAMELGDLEGVIAHAEASVAHARQTGIPVDLVEVRVAMVLREHARLLRGEDGAAQALQDILERTADEGTNIEGSAFALAKQMALQGDLGRFGWAREFVGRLADLHDPMSAERALLPLLDAWGAQAAGQPVAREPLERALAFSLNGRSTGVAVQAHFTLARRLAAEQPAEAIWLYKRSANLLQGLRNGLPAGEDSMQRSFLADHEPDLRRFIGLLIDTGRLAEARQAIAVLRNEELHEYTRRSRQASRTAAAPAMSLTPGEQQLDLALAPIAEHVRQASQEADRRADRHHNLRERNQATDPQADAAVAAAASELRALLDHAATRATAAPASPAPPRTRSLAPDAARLQYFVRPGGVDLLVERQGRAIRLLVAVPRDALGQAVQALRSALASADGDALPAAQRLHGWLLAPALPHLQGVRHLVVAADGVLRYVPFAGLHDGRRYAAERYALTMDLGPAASPALARHRPAGRPRLLALGRTLADAEHAALPGVRRELDGLVHLAAARVDGADDGAFTQAAMVRGLRAGPDVVHLASHFVLDAASEERSYLLLGDGTRLPLSRIAAMDWHQVHLAVLSACDSGVPSSGEGGELAGLAGALHRSGVTHVLATLWPVSDGATASWMAEFYAPWRSRAQAALPRADWVAQAQRAWLRRHAGTPLAHPHFWAAFTWMGA